MFAACPQKDTDATFPLSCLPIRTCFEIISSIVRFAPNGFVSTLTRIFVTSLSIESGYVMYTISPCFNCNDFNVFRGLSNNTSFFVLVFVSASFSEEVRSNKLGSKLNDWFSTGTPHGCFEIKSWTSEIVLIPFSPPPAPSAHSRRSVPSRVRILKSTIVVLLSRCCFLFRVSKSCKM